MMFELDFNKFSLFEVISKLETSSLPTWMDSTMSFLKEFASSQEIMVKTSGTTGEAKVYSVSKKAMEKSAESTIKFFDLTPGDRCLLALPSNFIAGKMMIVRAIVGKLKLNLIEPSSTINFNELPNFDFVPLVPLQVRNNLIGITPNKVKTLLIGGGKVDKELVEKLTENNIIAFESFAMTETLTHFAVKQVSPNTHLYFELLPNFSIETDSLNRLIIHPNEIVEQKVISNDIIELNGERKFRWIGRADNVINSGGIKIIPEEIETQLLPQIQQPFCVIGVPCNKFGEKVVLIIEGTEKKLALNFSQLPKHWAPREIRFYKELPRTESGKIKRKELRKLIK